MKPATSKSLVECQAWHQLTLDRSLLLLPVSVHCWRWWVTVVLPGSSDLAFVYTPLIAPGFSFTMLFCRGTKLFFWLKWWLPQMTSPKITSSDVSKTLRIIYKHVCCLCLYVCVFYLLQWMDRCKCQLSRCQFFLVSFQLISI